MADFTLSGSPIFHLLHSLIENRIEFGLGIWKKFGRWMDGFFLTTLMIDMTLMFSIHTHDIIIASAFCRD